MSIYSPKGINAKIFPYQHFQGIDSSRDPAAMDTGDNLHLVSVKNGFCDWRGVINRDPSAERREISEGVVSHVTFFGRNKTVFARRDEGGTSLCSDTNINVQDVYPRNAVITSTQFNLKTVVATAGYNMYAFDGYAWDAIDTVNAPKPAYAVTTNRRLAVAGIPGRETQVLFSRVDNFNIWPEDESTTSTEVTKAVYIDLNNYIGTADQIKGLATFENFKFVVFTNDRAWVYSLDADYTRWTLDDKSHVEVGVVSHNAITRAGQDTIFAARNGIYSLRRSSNGLQIINVPLSSKIDLLYRSLVKNCPNPEEISAFYDVDNGQYNLYFPQTDYVTTRLTMTVSPVQDEPSKFSVGNFLNSRCGASLGGVTVLGTPGGLYTQRNIEDELELAPEMVVVTPILWQGQMTEQKQSVSFILQATGKGTITVEAFDEEGRALSDMTFDIEPEVTDGTFSDVPLVAQYDRKFEHIYRGVQFRFKTNGVGLLKIIGFAVQVRKGT